MKIIKVRNVNQALHEGLWWLSTAGTRAESRNGPVLVAPGPVATIYTNPLERVLFHPARDANPVFHLIEALWMLAGRDTVDDLLPFNSNYANFAEGNGHVHGAYGHRWRRAHGFDQLRVIVDELMDNPNSRRVVLSMWIPSMDLAKDMRDVPCNTHVYFSIRDGRLDMTVCCRSNDAVWGAYGANVVTFSILQELLAYWIGVGLGEYVQFSNNFHIYPELDVVNRTMAALENEPADPYAADVRAIPLLHPGERADQFLADCDDLFEVRGWNNPRTAFFRDVVLPLHTAYLDRKEGLPWKAPEGNIDWLVAFRQWSERRATK